MPTIAQLPAVSLYLKDYAVGSKVMWQRSCLLAAWAHARWPLHRSTSHLHNHRLWFILLFPIQAASLWASMMDHHSMVSALTGSLQDTTGMRAVVHSLLRWRWTVVCMVY